MAEMDKFRARAIERLTEFLPRAMADGVLDDTERQELMGMLSSGVLTRDDVQTAFRDFLNGLHFEITVDGVVTDEERERLRSVVGSLRLPATFIPDEIHALINL
ncbi:MAG: hypothetical protein SGI86_17230 [Deltaproteobacteria bacterium]|nr:hypothetical protein [Deltaproteobacteria bacterium]